MPVQATSRSSRRAATQHTAIVAPDLESDSDVPEQTLDSASTAKTSPPRRRLQRRTTVSTEPDLSHTDASGDLDNQENTDPTADAREPALKKRTAHAARRSVRASRKSLATSVSASSSPVPESNVSAIIEEESAASAEDATVTTAPNRVPSDPQDMQDETGLVSPSHTEMSSPLGGALQDITREAVNITTKADVQTADAEAIKAQPSAVTLEKPMDIVIRARAKPQTTAQESLPTTRTVITYLILNNFKSYAGRQEVGPFHASFSSVVGPNGSGKSNVIDSLLFVFGFRASKMRQGKISSLIHNSASHPDLDHCEVEVHFQEIKDLPDGQKETVPDSNLVISRRAFKNNSSSYYINGKTSNFTAVTTLLKDRGVDLDHKRFLILQGEVESIAQMKPKAANEHDDGLLEYLEDIIGTSKYKAPIEEAAQQTDVLNEVCVEKNARVQHVEKEKKGLESRKNAAIAYIRDENDLSIKQSALCQIFVSECQDNIEVTKETVEQMHNQLDDELERHRGSEQGILELQNQLKAESRAFEELDRSSQAIVKQIAKLDKENVKFDEKRKHLDAKSKKLEKAVASGHSGIAEATAYLQRLADDLAGNASSIADIEKKLQTEQTQLEKVRTGLQGKTQGFSDQIAKNQKLLEPWIAQINDKRSAIAVATSELAILRERDEAGLQAVAEMQSRIERLDNDRVEKVQAIKNTTTSKQAREKELDKIKSSICNLMKQEPLAKAKLSTARQRAEEAKTSLAKSQTQGNVLAGLSRLKDSGRISGFHGRLGNLGTIDAKFDVAVSTACPALDNLVVDSVEVGQRCIEYLRKNNLGRANFICLDKLGTRDLSSIETPEGATRLFDLVKSKEGRFRPAFYSVMQNTLVANDLAQANRIAYGAKRWRVVTLDGKLIDKSGTMSGGGNRIARGAMSSKLVRETSSDQVVALEAEQEAEERQVRDLQNEMESQQAALRQAQDEIPVLETMLQRLQLELDSLDRNLADCQRRKEELGQEKHPDKSSKTRRATLEQTISGLEDEIVSVQKNMMTIEAEIKELQDKIMEVGGVQLRLQKAKVDGLREEIDTLVEEMAVGETNQAKTQKQLSKHTKAKESAEAELASIAADLARLEEEGQAQADDALGIRREAEHAQEAIESKKEELAALHAKVEVKTAELNETRGVEIEMRNKLEEGQKMLSENHKRLKYWQDKLSKLSIQDVGDVAETGEEQRLISYTRDELGDLDKDLLKGEIAMLEEKTQNGNADASVIAEYRRRVEEHEARSGDLAEAVAQRDAAKRRVEELRRLRLEGFMEGFSTISLRLKEMYQMITMGGNAELELVDSLDPFSEGILFSVMPPKKSWKNISNLSGGEKTLSSLALVFALHHYKPTPLYVMDEIDAALDFRNVSIVASYIKERTKNAQFIVISLRNNMFELAARLVGVYKVNQMTKSVTVENRDYIVSRA